MKKNKGFDTVSKKWGEYIARLEVNKIEEELTAITYTSYSLTDKTLELVTDLSNPSSRK